MWFCWCKGRRRGIWWNEKYIKFGLGRSQNLTLCTASEDEEDRFSSFWANFHICFNSTYSIRICQEDKIWKKLSLEYFYKEFISFLNDVSTNFSRKLLHVITVNADVELVQRDKKKFKMKFLNFKLEHVWWWMREG